MADPESNEDFHLWRRANLKNKAWPCLEARCMKVQPPDTQPNEDWWGSEVLNDQLLDFFAILGLGGFVGSNNVALEDND